MRHPTVNLIFAISLLSCRVLGAPLSEDTNEYDRIDREGSSTSGSGSQSVSRKSSVDPASAAAVAGYMSLPHLVPRYRPVPAWDIDYDIDGNGISDQDPEMSSEERFKRAGPSLSIVNPLDVLRQRLLLEMARRQMRESHRQVAENRKLMKAIGKRGTFLRQPELQQVLHRNAITAYDTM